MHKGILVFNPQTQVALAIGLIVFPSLAASQLKSCPYSDACR
jgi:hypothetical protein